MIRHIVLTTFKPDTPPEQIADVLSGLGALVDIIPGASSFVAGPSKSPEQMERGYTHGFSIDFDSWETLQVYADNPAHKALGARLVDYTVGGKDGLLVMDIDEMALPGGA